MPGCWKAVHTLHPPSPSTHHLARLLTASTAPKDDAPTNVLVLLHGLGDKHDSFTKLGQQMSLPETVCISAQAPNNLLDLGGFHWGDDIIFDSTSGGLDADAGFKQSTDLLLKLLQDGLIGNCAFLPRELMLFGFGQGAMAALSSAGSSSSSSLRTRAVQN